jgi:hypothetical protein
MHVDFGDIQPAMPQYGRSGLEIRRGFNGSRRQMAELVERPAGNTVLDTHPAYCLVESGVVIEVADSA